MIQLLSYACWDPILQNLNAIARIQISLRCPPLESLNVKLPIKTKSMKIGRNYIQMDDFRIEQSVLLEPESDARKAVFRMLQSSEEELAEQQRNLEFFRDEKVIRTIENLKASINYLKQRHTDLRPKNMNYHQLVAIFDNQKTVLGTARNTCEYDVYIYLFNKIFGRNLRIDTVNVTSDYENMPKFDVSLLKQARLLVFERLTGLKLLLGLTNSFVYFARNCIGTARLTEELVADWQNKRRPIGTRYVFPCSKSQVQTMIDYVERVAGARQVMTTDERAFRPYAIIFPMSEDAEIAVFCLKTSEIVMDINYVQFHFVIQPKLEPSVL